MIYLSTLLKIISNVFWVLSEIARLAAQFLEKSELEPHVPIEVGGLVIAGVWKSGIIRGCVSALRKCWVHWEKENLWVLEY